MHKYQTSKCETEAQEAAGELPAKPALTGPTDPFRPVYFVLIRDIKRARIAVVNSHVDDDGWLGARRAWESGTVDDVVPAFRLHIFFGEFAEVVVIPHVIFIVWVEFSKTECLFSAIVPGNYSFGFRQRFILSRRQRNRKHFVFS